MGRYFADVRTSQQPYLYCAMTDFLKFCLPTMCTVADKLRVLSMSEEFEDFFEKQDKLNADDVEALRNVIAIAASNWYSERISDMGLGVYPADKLAVSFPDIVALKDQLDSTSFSYAQAITNSIDMFPSLRKKLIELGEVEFTAKLPVVGSTFTHHNGNGVVYRVVGCGNRKVTKLSYLPSVTYVNDSTGATFIKNIYNFRRTMSPYHDEN